MNYNEPSSTLLGTTPPKTNMTLENHHVQYMFNRKYIFKWLFFHCHVSFRRVNISFSQYTFKNDWFFFPVWWDM